LLRSLLAANWYFHLFADPGYLSRARRAVQGRLASEATRAGRRVLPSAPQIGETSATADRATQKGAAMMTPGTGFPRWAMVDEGWGRRAVDFSALSEPGNCREYVAVHHRLGVDAGDRLLDVACGSGFAIELARLRGASCSGIDASARLVAVARDRNPECDIRIGDMHALPWDPASFDVITSFRGIWGTTPQVVDEIHRVLRPGGRAGITVWGHLKVSPGAWALAPFRLAAAEKVDNQAVMVSLGRPGAGEQLLESCGFLNVERMDVPFAWEFADPQLYARALASTGPAYEAIQNVGEAEFHRAAVEQAQGQLRDGLPLRAEIKVVGYLARKPEGADRA
jgi:SAM-dependent methyltransferase